MRRFAVALIIVVLALAVSPSQTGANHPSSPAAAPSGASVGALSPGDSVFWNHPASETGSVPDASMCGVAGSCWTYALGVLAGGAHTTLRIAINWPDKDNEFGMQVQDPNGNKVYSQQATGSLYDLEAFISAPLAGTYAVTVYPFDVASPSPFRGRAYLASDTASASKGVHALLPDLRARPPDDFGFVTPLNDGYPAPYNGGLGAAGFAPMSCTTDETVTTGATRCLRFSSGPENVGSGVLELHFPIPAILESRVPCLAEVQGSTCPMSQRVYRSDGTFYDRNAGTFVFHGAHLHFHYTGMLTQELYHVDDARSGQVTAVGAGRKDGFCTLDERIIDFHSFANTAQGPAAVGQGCFVPSAPGGEVYMGIDPGWGDVYKWQRSGQMVDFTNQADGCYLLRVQANADGKVLESNPGNDTSYALIKVAGTQIQTIERGYGSGPWDRGRLVVANAYGDTQRGGAPPAGLKACGNIPAP